MAIGPNNPVAPLQPNYKVGSAFFGDSICVMPGDRIIIASVTYSGTPPPGATNSALPDGTTGAGAGYVPHIAYRPWYYRTKDINDPPQGGKPAYGVGGNAGQCQTIRVDLQYLYCRYGGVVSFEGGKGPPGYTGGGGEQGPQATIVYYWERAAMNSGLIAPTSSSGFVPHTLTFINSFDPIDGTAIPIARPVNASRVWTPQARGIVLDYGAGTYNMVTRTDGQARAINLCAFTRVTLTDKSEGEVIFEIDL